MRIETDCNEFRPARVRVVLIMLAFLAASVIFFAGWAKSTVGQQNKCKPGSRSEIGAAQEKVDGDQRKVAELQLDISKAKPGGYQETKKSELKQAETDLAAAQAELNKLRCVGTPQCVKAEPMRIKLAKDAYNKAEAKAEDLELQAKDARAQADSWKAELDNLSCAASTSGAP